MTSSIFLISLSAVLAVLLVLLAAAYLYALKKTHKLHIEHKDKLQALELLLGAKESEHAQLQVQAGQAQNSYQQAQLNLDNVKSEYLSNKTALEVLKATQRSEQAAFSEKLSWLNTSEKSMRIEFENLANQLLEVKAQALKKEQEGFFHQTLQPLKEQLGEFRQRMDKVHDADSKDRVSMLNELSQLRSLNLKISDDAINLTNALKGNTKFQGNWGELVLERVLETSGLRAGHEFELQASRKDADGKTFLPDVIVNLPDNKHLIVDSKVSLVSYQAYCEASSEEDRNAHLKKHIKSVQSHIKDLSDKKYDSLEGVNSLDFVFLFMPIEAAFLLALDSPDNLYQLAHDKHVVLVSPSTLFATLRTIENMWRYERQNVNAEEIAKQAGGLYDQCVLVAESLEDVGSAINKTQVAYERTFKRLSDGKGNVIRRIESIKQLGAKTKKQLPSSLQIETQLDAEFNHEADPIASAENQ